MKGLFLNRSTLHIKQPNNIELLASHQNLEIVMVEIEEGRGAIFSPYKSHKSMEFAYLLEGELQYIDGDETIVLNQGDSIYHNKLESPFTVFANKYSRILTFTNNGDYEEQTQMYKTMSETLDEIQKKDNYTKNHSKRVGIYAQKLEGHSNERVESLIDLMAAANSHDVGKCKVPDEILLKPGRFTDEERRVMNNHSTYSYEILKEEFKMSEKVCYIAACHHERYNGTGYPKGLKGKEIPIEARIISIVDTFDAITTTRPYQKARPALEAIVEMERFSQEYDPELFNIFKKLVLEEVISLNDLPEDHR